MSHEGLWTALNTDNAKRHYAKIARIAGRQFKEAGFVIYEPRQQGGSHTVSRLVEAEDIDFFMEDPALSVADAMARPHFSLNMGSLCLRNAESDDAPDRLRDDLALMLHSHVVFERERRPDNSWLAPSPVDLEGWDAALAYNPGLVEAVTIARGRLLKMFLYRMPPERPGTPYYQQLTEADSSTTIMRTLAESGVSTADLTYDLRARSFTPESAGAFQSLFDVEV